MAGKVGTEKQGKVGWIFFDQPERFNAMSMGMWEGAREAVQALAADSGVRVIVLRGAGEKAFLSGADLSEFKSDDPTAVAAFQRKFGAVVEQAFEAFARVEKPVIAMIYGICLGAGVAVAGKADFRIASEDASFGIPAARLGVAYVGPVLRDLVNLVGPSEAKAMLFTAKRMKAAEALRIGLINEVTSAQELERRVIELAEIIASNAPLSIRATKEAIDQIAQERPDPQRLEKLAAACLASTDHAEGVRAFAEKRRPVFQGR